jgi:glycosyltransferase involved in cell wall biosynthesis
MTNTNSTQSNALSNKVSLICTTYRRYRCIERIIEQYLRQDYENKELIIFNTDTDNPMSLDLEITDRSIKVINCSIDYETGLPYTNRGSICRDAVTHASGDLFMLMDDDDIYLPWYVRQAVDGILLNGKDAWKPEMSFFATPDKLELTRNTLEASVIVRMSRIREIGFRQDITGYEGLSWYTRLRDEGELDEHTKSYVPSYCFNWSDPSDMAGHKQSGDINNPDNFENHKKGSGDVSDKPLIGCGPSIMNEAYSKYFRFLLDHRSEFDSGLWDKYVSDHIIS